jgi:hypothetical protein
MRNEHIAFFSVFRIKIGVAHDGINKQCLSATAPGKSFAGHGFLFSPTELGFLKN